MSAFLCQFKLPLCLKVVASGNNPQWDGKRENFWMIDIILVISVAVDLPSLTYPPENNLDKFIQITF